MINHSRRLPPQTISTRVLVAAVSLSVWFAIREPRIINRRVEQLAARRVHTPEVAGSSPASATRFDRAALAGDAHRSRCLRSPVFASALCFSLCALGWSGAFLFGCASDVARRWSRRAFFGFFFLLSSGIWANADDCHFKRGLTVFAMGGLSYFLERL
jgi:hypothetical protein